MKKESGKEKKVRTQRRTFEYGRNNVGYLTHNFRKIQFTQPPHALSPYVAIVEHILGWDTFCNSILSKQNLSIYLWDIQVKASGVNGKNGILLCTKIFWPTVRKNCSSDREKLLKFEAEAKNFQKFWDHLNNLFKQWKVRPISGNRMLF